MKSNLERRKDAKKQICNKYDCMNNCDHYRFNPRKIDNTSVDEKHNTRYIRSLKSEARTTLQEACSA